MLNWHFCVQFADLLLVVLWGHRPLSHNLLQGASTSSLQQPFLVKEGRTLLPRKKEVKASSKRCYYKNLFQHQMDMAPQGEKLCPVFWKKNAGPSQALRLLLLHNSKQEEAASSSGLHGLDGQTDGRRRIICQDRIINVEPPGCDPSYLPDTGQRGWIFFLAHGSGFYTL